MFQFLQVLWVIQINSFLEKSPQKSGRLRSEDWSGQTSYLLIFLQQRNELCQKTLKPLYIASSENNGFTIPLWDTAHQMPILNDTEEFYALCMGFTRDLDVK